MRVEQWIGLLLVLSILAKAGEIVLRWRFRKQAMRGFRAMERLGGRTR